jgi:hypothetical protein
MRKVLFEITSKISCWLDKFCMWIVADGRKYNQHPVMFHVVDNLATKVYNFGYNNFSI